MTNQISCFFIHYSFCFFLSILQSFCEVPTPAFLHKLRSSAADRHADRSLVTGSGMAAAVFSARVVPAAGRIL